MNQSIHEQAFGWGAAGALAEGAPLAGRAERTIYGQCVGDAAPALAVRADRETVPLALDLVAFPDGAPLVLISSDAEDAPTVRSRTKALGLPVVSLFPEVVPTWFGALRFAAVIAVGLGDLQRLSPEQLAAVRGATAAGATLVISVGEATAPPDALAGLSPVKLGEPGRPSPALLSGAPHATGQRALQAGGGVVRVRADDAPIVVDSGFGLGVVRVVATPLRDLGADRVGRVVWRSEGDALSQVLGWLDQTPSPPAERRTVLSGWSWGLLASFALVALFARRLRSAAVVAGALVWGVALAWPPVETAQAVVGGRALVVPFADQALHVGVLDVDFAAGGPLTLPADAALSLDDSKPGGACALATDGAQVVATDGPPGRRQRLAYFALGADVSGAADAPFPSYPAGPLAEQPTAVADAQAPLLGATVPHLRVLPAPLSAGDPLVLRAPKQPEPED